MSRNLINWLAVIGGAAIMFAVTYCAFKVNAIGGMFSLMIAVNTTLFNVVSAATANTNK